MDTFGVTKLSQEERSISKNSQLNSSATTFKDYGYGLTNSSNAIVTFRTPENKDVPIACTSNEVELVCRDAISNECNIKDCLKTSPFDVNRVFELILQQQHEETWQHESLGSTHQELMNLHAFSKFLQSYEHLGYFFTETQTLMLFRRLDKN